MSWTYVLVCGCEQQLVAGGWRRTVRCPKHPVPLSAAVPESSEQA